MMKSGTLYFKPLDNSSSSLILSTMSLINSKFDISNLLSIPKKTGTKCPVLSSTLEDREQREQSSDHRPHPKSLSRGGRDLKIWHLEYF
jgi:hypothetical protein